MNDHIADMISRIKNAGLTKKASIVLPYSAFKFSILETLMRGGFVASVAKRGKKVSKFIDVGIAYENNEPKVIGAKRISRPSKRVYIQSKDIKPFRQGFGATVISTPEGVLLDKEARVKKVGGEALFSIW